MTINLWFLSLTSLTYPKKHAYFNWAEIFYKPIFLGNSNASPNTGFSLRRDGKSTNLTIFPVVTWPLPFILWGPSQVSSLLGGLPPALHQPHTDNASVLLQLLCHCIITGLSVYLAAITMLKSRLLLQDLEQRQRVGGCLDRRTDGVRDNDWTPGSRGIR